MAARNKQQRGKGKSNQSGGQKTKQVKVVQPKFATGERALPPQVEARPCKTSKEGRSLVHLPIPKADSDQSGVKTVGWIVRAKFAVKNKFLFVNSVQSGQEAMIKVRVEDRDKAPDLIVIGEPEEVTVVAFQIIPYYINESMMTMK